MNLAPHPDDNLGMQDPELEAERKRRELLRQRLEQKLMEREESLKNSYDIDKQQRMGDSQSQRDVAFMGLMNQSAAKFGSIGGQTPDTSSSQKYTENLLGTMNNYNDSMYQDRRDREALKNYLMRRMDDQLQNSSENVRKREGMISDANLMRQKNEFQRLAEEKKLDAEQKAKEAERKHEMAMLNQKQEHDKRMAGMARPTSNMVQNQPSKGRPGTDNAVAAQESEADQPYMMAEEERTTVKNLATKNASKIAISNQMKGYLQQYRNAKSPDQKVVIGRQMLKVLNSPEGADAIGAEESRRLGSLLEYQLFNVFNPGPMFGRDLEGFDQQVMDTIAAVDEGVNQNQDMINSLKSGKGMKLTPVQPAPKVYKDGSLVASPEQNSQPSKEDADAMRFIQDNPSDPRVPKLKEALKQKGLL